MFGLTHREDGSPIIKEPKVLRVSIGLAKGPAINTWTQRAPDNSVVWKVMFGYKKDEVKTMTFKTRAEAEAKFEESFKKAPVCPYPRKLAYFTFLRPAIIDGKEQFLPDWSAIESHGPTPTEIDVVFLTDTPLDGAFQMWSSSELRCKGDGINAMRVVTLVDRPEDEAQAKLAREAGEKYYPIHAGCATCGCKFTMASVSNGKEQPAPCKPGADLKFQLASNIRVGGVSYYHTTGIRSIQGMFSSLSQIQALTGGRLRGVPVKMVLRPFRSNHNNSPATHYAVSLEFRAPDVATLRQRLLESAFEMRQIATGAPPQHVNLIGPGTEPELPEEAGEDEEQPLGAEAMTAEFYPEAAEEGAEPGPVTPEPPPAAAATAAKTAGLAEKMERSRRKPEPAPLQAAQVQAGQEVKKDEGTATPVVTPTPAQGGDLF
jgi:hypothetical protein